MTLWIILAAMMLSAVASLVIAALGASPPAAKRSDYDITVYWDQLRDLEADVARGVVTPEEEESARTEISRRMITAAAEETEEGDKPEKSRPRAARTVVTMLLIVAVPVVATPIYLLTGSPNTPGQPFANRTDIRDTDDSALPEGFEDGIARLVARLQEASDDVEGWITLGRALMIARRHDAAANAFRRATTLSPNNAQAQSLLGEAIVFATGGTVTPAALRAFEAANEADPQNLAARYYGALERAQAGEVREAFDVWLTLVAESPSDAPWMPDLRARLKEAAEALDVELASVMPDTLPPSGAGQPQRPEIDETATAPAADEQGEQIRAMVARLATRLEAEPDDADGWLMLGRSYAVLGDPESSRAAYARAAELRPNDVPVLAAYARSLLDDPSGAGPLPTPARDLYIRILDLDGENPEALYFAGLAEAQAGDTASAAARWEHLLTLLDPASETYRVVQDALSGLAPANQP